MLKIKQITSENVQDVVASKLRLKIGVGRDFSYADIEEITEIKARTIKSYCLGEVAIPLVNFLKIAAAIESTNFANAPFELIGYGGLYNIKAETRTPNQMLSQIASRLNMVAVHLADGKIDHQESAEQKDELTSLAAELVEYTTSL